MNLDVTPEASGFGSLTNHLVAGGLWAQVAVLLWQVDGGVNHLDEGCIFCDHSEQVVVHLTVADKVNFTTIYILSYHYDQVIAHLSVALLFTLHCRAARPTEQTRESLTRCVLGKLLFPLL